MTFAEIKDLTSDELRKRYNQLRGDLFEAKMKHSMGQLGNPIEVRQKRRDVARLLTAISMKLGQTAGPKKSEQRKKG